MNTINVKVQKANFLINSGPGSLQNFTVEEESPDMDSVTGYGPTLELALNDFEAWYSVRYDKEIKAIITQTNY